MIGVTLIIHEIFRKKGETTQHNRKTKQHNILEKSCLGWDSMRRLEA